MYKQDLVLNNLQWLICHKTKLKPNQNNLMWIAWNRNVFDNQTVYSYETELFEIELLICIEMDLALNNL